MFKKISKKNIVVLSIVLIVAIVYLAMFLSTNSVIEYIEKLLNGEISYKTTEGTCLSRYNKSRFDAAKIDYSVSRVFVVHNFFDGYVWINYKYQVFDSDGNLLNGGVVTNSRLTIHRENGEWVIVDVKENP